MGIRASASTPSGLFEAMGLGLYALMTDLRTVRPREARTVRATGVDVESLTVDFLSRLLLLQQDDGFLVRQLHVQLHGRPPTSLTARALGEPMDPARHPRSIEVKAVTLHRLTVDTARGRARVIVDI